MNFSRELEYFLNKIIQGNSGLGINIAGGSDQNYIIGDAGIYVTKIIADGAAHRDGRLAVGDQLMMVDGVDLTNVTHDVCVQATIATR